MYPLRPFLVYLQAPKSLVRVSHYQIDQTCLDSARMSGMTSHSEVLSSFHYLLEIAIDPHRLRAIATDHAIAMIVTQIAHSGLVTRTKIVAGILELFTRNQLTDHCFPRQERQPQNFLPAWTATMNTTRAT